MSERNHVSSQFFKSVSDTWSLYLVQIFILIFECQLQVSIGVWRKVSSIPWSPRKHYTWRYRTLSITSPDIHASYHELPIRKAYRGVIHRICSDIRPLWIVANDLGTANKYKVVQLALLQHTLSISLHPPTLPTLPPLWSCFSRSRFWVLGRVPSSVLRRVNPLLAPANLVAVFCKLSSKVWMKEGLTTPMCLSYYMCWLVGIK